MYRDCILRRLTSTLTTLTALLALAACDAKPTNPKSSTGAQLFEAQGCARCHGDHGEGSSLAPVIVGAKTNWSPEALIEYLADPHAYAAKTPRLSEIGKRYMLPMPAYAMLSPAERGKLADFVLGLH